MGADGSRIVDGKPDRLREWDVRHWLHHCCGTTPHLDWSRSAEYIEAVLVLPAVTETGMSGTAVAAAVVSAETDPA